FDRNGLANGPCGAGVGTVVSSRRGEVKCLIAETLQSPFHRDSLQPMKLTTIPNLARNANRLREVLTILSKYGLADWISRHEYEFAKGLFKARDGAALVEGTTETRIRRALTDLGTAFIKIGQILSTRPDLAGPALAKELSSLQCDAPADTPSTIRAAVEVELGGRLEDWFAEFDLKPLASASIGQVHRARLKSGQPVVVKVQHRGIENKIRIDLEILLGLAELAEYLEEWRRYRPRATAEEFQRMLLGELAFGREERNIEQFAANFANDKTVRFPAPYPELCTSRVLTMEMLEGIKLVEADRLKAAGHNLEEIARRGAQIYLEMIFRDGFYHADPHPGNILVLPDGSIGMLDCGMVGRLDERMRDQIEDMLLAIANGDAAQLTAIITRIGLVPPELDQASLSNDIADFLAYYAGQSLSQLDLSGALTEMIEIIRRYQILLPTGIALLIKVLVMLEGTSRLLNPTFS